MLYSFLLWAAIIYTIMGCIQLIFLERTLKRDDPKKATYGTMSASNKQTIHKILIKIGLGLLALGALALLDHYLIIR